MLANINSLPEHVILEDVTCNDGKCQFTWKAQNADGSRRELNSTELAVVRSYYEEVREGVERRQLEAKREQLLQEKKTDMLVDAAELLVDGITDITQRGSSTELLIDSDEDGIADMRVVLDKDGKANYVPIGQQESSSPGEPSFTDVAVIDGDSDGRHDQVILQSANGHRLIGSDTNADGTVDLIEERDENGQLVKQEPTIQLSILGGSRDAPQPTLAGEMSWQLFLRNQGLQPGQDGYLTNVSPKDGSPLPTEVVKNYYQNGVWTDYPQSVSTGQDFANLANSSVTVVYSETVGTVTDLLEAASIPSQSALMLNGARSIAMDLANNHEVRFFAHSEGAAFIKETIPLIKENLTSLGAPPSRIHDLTIITLGGFTPKAEYWGSEVNVIAINNNDPIPALQGWLDINPELRLSNHTVLNYYPIVQVLVNPSSNLSHLYGNSYNAADWDLVRLLVGQ